MYYLGTIVVANNATKSNLDTAADFDIPENLFGVELQSDTAGVYAGCGVADNYAVTAPTGLRLPQHDPVKIPLAGKSAVVSVVNATGGEAKVKVFAIFGA